MNRKEYLLTCLAEEACEVGQRVSKSIRFGLTEIQSGQPFTNEKRLVDEIKDLISVATILYQESMISYPLPHDGDVQRKLDRIEKYAEISRREGTLTDGRSD